MLVMMMPIKFHFYLSNKLSTVVNLLIRSDDRIDVNMLIFKLLNTLCCLLFSFC